MSSRFSVSMFHHLKILVLHLCEILFSYFTDKFLFFFIKMPNLDIGSPGLIF